MIRNFNIDYIYKVYVKLKKYYEIHGENSILDDAFYDCDTRFFNFYDWYVERGNTIKIKQGWTKTTVNELKEKGW